jgi:NADH dehydrogenase
MKAKDIAEKAIRESGMEYAILRPSWIYGPGDHSMNRFIWFCRHLPSRARDRGRPDAPVYPAYVKDVARASRSWCAARTRGTRSGDRRPPAPHHGRRDPTVQEVLGRRRPLPASPARPDEAPRAPHGRSCPTRCSRRARIDFITQTVEIDPAPAAEYLGFAFRPLRAGLDEYVA